MSVLLHELKSVIQVLKKLDLSPVQITIFRWFLSFAIIVINCHSVLKGACKEVLTKIKNLVCVCEGGGVESGEAIDWIQFLMGVPDMADMV